MATGPVLSAFLVSPAPKTTASEPYKEAWRRANGVKQYQTEVHGCGGQYGVTGTPAIAHA